MNFLVSNDQSSWLFMNTRLSLLPINHQAVGAVRLPQPPTSNHFPSPLMNSFPHGKQEQVPSYLAPKSQQKNLSMPIEMPNQTTLTNYVGFSPLQNSTLETAINPYLPLSLKNSLGAGLQKGLEVPQSPFQQIINGQPPSDGNYRRCSHFRIILDLLPVPAHPSDSIANVKEVITNDFFLKYLWDF